MQYIHSKNQSVLAKIVEFFIPFVKPRSEYKKTLSRTVPKIEKANVPFFIKMAFNVKTTENNSRKTWTISPKNKKSEKTILFVHGGAYVHTLLIFHWMFLYKLAKQTGATIVVPDYPLAPQNTYLDTYNFIEKVYDEWIQEIPSKKHILMGDSAGGGFCLGFAQYLKEKGKALPSQLIVLAPWLDLTMKNPEIDKIEEKDKMLSIESLIMAGESYAGKSSTKNYMISPIYGNFESLPRISLFIGGNDILYPDCEKWKDMLLRQNVDFNYYYYPKMFHDWMMVTPLAESKKALKQIVDLVKE